MFARLGTSQPTQDTDAVARAAGALALAALAVIHVVDLPATLGPTPLVGIGYFGIIVAAVLTGGGMISWSNWVGCAPPGARGPAPPGGDRRCPPGPRGSS